MAFCQFPTVYLTVSITSTIILASQSEKSRNVTLFPSCFSSVQIDDERLQLLLNHSENHYETFASYLSRDSYLKARFNSSEKFFQLLNTLPIVSIIEILLHQALYFLTIRVNLHFSTEMLH